MTFNEEVASRTIVEQKTLESNTSIQR